MHGEQVVVEGNVYEMVRWNRKVYKSVANPNQRLNFRPIPFIYNVPSSVHRSRSVDYRPIRQQTSCRVFSIPCRAPWWPMWRTFMVNIEASCDQILKAKTFFEGWLLACRQKRPQTVKSWSHRHVMAGLRTKVQCDEPVRFPGRIDASAKQVLHTCRVLD